MTVVMTGEYYGPPPRMSWEDYSQLDPAQDRRQDPRDRYAEEEDLEPGSLEWLLREAQVSYREPSRAPPVLEGGLREEYRQELDRIVRENLVSQASERVNLKHRVEVIHKGGMPDDEESCNALSRAIWAAPLVSLAKGLQHITRPIGACYSDTMVLCQDPRGVIEEPKPRMPLQPRSADEDLTGNTDGIQFLLLADTSSNNTQKVPEPSKRPPVPRAQIHPHELHSHEHPPHPRERHPKDTHTESSPEAEDNTWFGSLSTWFDVSSQRVSDDIATLEEPDVPHHLHDPEDPPADAPPAEAAPAETSLATAPLAEAPPAEVPLAEVPPAEAPPDEVPPAEAIPTEAHLPAEAIHAENPPPYLPAEAQQLEAPTAPVVQADAAPTALEDIVNAQT
eukprot:TRINITY_DN23142_c0_g1_i1.p1 TRINITY_DN23142_c0_g1~~TRINITY_DN23142_c0_g1_i1.p1  ORF type:complete len:393 (+),score=75.73 TRINITY_DN23142_c0_g1_i1:40-1218(+)